MDQLIKQAMQMQQMKVMNDCHDDPWSAVQVKIKIVEAVLTLSAHLHKGNVIFMVPLLALVLSENFDLHYHP